MGQGSTLLSLQAPQLPMCGTQQMGEGMASVLFFWAKNPADYANVSLAIFFAVGILSIASLFFGAKQKPQPEPLGTVCDSKSNEGLRDESVRR